MDLIVYIFGTLYMISSLFRFSNYYSKYMIENKYIEHKKIEKSLLHNKVDEWIYSTVHSFFITFLSAYSLKKNIFSLDYQETKVDEGVKLCVSLAFSYFSLDLFKCILQYNILFIIHHLCAIHLLYHSIQSFENKPYEGYFMMAYLFLLECNTPLMNLGIALKTLDFDSNIYGFVWIIHLISYILCRLIMIPYISYYYFYYKGNEIDYTQIPSIIIIYFGSCFWAYKQYKGIEKYVLLKK